MYSSLLIYAVLLVLYTLRPELSCSELVLSVTMHWGVVKLFTSPNLGLGRDPQPPRDLNTYQMEQIQRDFSALLGLSVSLCFLVSYPALQLTSLFCRKEQNIAGYLGIITLELSLAHVWSSALLLSEASDIRCFLREATGLIEPLAWRAFLCVFAALFSSACLDTVVLDGIYWTY